MVTMFFFSLSFSFGKWEKVYASHNIQFSSAFLFFFFSPAIYINIYIVRWNSEWMLFIAICWNFFFSLKERACSCVKREGGGKWKCITILFNKTKSSLAIWHTYAAAFYRSFHFISWVHLIFDNGLHGEIPSQLTERLRENIINFFSSMKLILLKKCVGIRHPHFFSVSRLHLVF